MLLGIHLKLKDFLLELYIYIFNWTAEIEKVDYLMHTIYANPVILVFTVLVKGV